MNLVQVAEEIQHRIIHIFGRDMEGKRSTNGGNPKLDHDPHFRDYVWFYEVRHQFARSSNCNADARDSSFTRTTEGAWELPIKPAGMISSLQTHNYMLNRFSNIIKNLTVFEENMKANIDKTFGLVYSQQILLALIDKGMSREEAYDLVQPKAMESWESKVPLQELASQDEKITAALTSDELQACFDESHHLRRVDTIFKRAGLE